MAKKKEEKKEPKKDEKKDGKKDKKNKNKDSEAESGQDEMLLATTELEPEPEEVQFTETSYTSASFESLPPIPEDLKKKKPKPKKKLGEKSSSVIRKLSSEMLQWSEEDIKAPYADLIVVEKEEEPTDKKKKGKKGKKKEVEVVPDFEKPKNWKKMAKKEREAWLVQRIEEWKAEKEAEKAAMLAGAKEKRNRLERERLELATKELEEQEVRKDYLQKAVNLFQKFERQKLAYVQKKTKLAEWEQYLRCDGLPNARVVMELNTFLNIWRENKVVDDNELHKKFIQVLPLLEMLEIICANSRQYTQRQAENYDTARLALRNQLATAIEMASYTLLRNLEKNLVLESTRLATYQREFKGLRLNIWVAMKWPTRKPLPIEPEKEPVELSFPSMKVSVILPTIIDGSCVCVRAARSLIDLLSEKCRSFALMFDMPKQYEDFFSFNVKELMEAQNIAKKQDDSRKEFYKKIRERSRELEAFLKANIYIKTDKEKEELDNLTMAEPNFMPSPRDQISFENERNFQTYLKSCMSKTRRGEVNLRKYRICGGVLNLDLIVTPPQPKRLQFGVVMTALQLPKALQAMEYQVDYRAPEPPPPGVTRTPEEIELEIKRMEEIYEKLAMVFIDLPQDVMWNEPPVVCQWQDSRDLWTTSFVNDYKFNEDKLTIQFRTGVLWPIGIATLRYSNMPYQAWDVKPDPDGKGVIVIVTGICVTVTWICVSNWVKLKSIKNASTHALQEHFNKKYTVKEMVQLMRNAGCDFFPDFDGYSHVHGSSRKEWPMERHLYHAMAFLSRAYNFQFSRWNNGAGYRNIVLQLREAVDKKRVAKLQLMHVHPERTNLLKCVEAATELDYEPQLGLPFFPDLFTFNMMYGSSDARRMTFNMKYKLVETVFELLVEIKPCSYS